MSRMWWYTSFSLVLWAINPELRRLYDWKAGFSALEILSVLPLVSLSPHVWSLTFGGGWRRLPPLVATAGWIWIGGFTYAFIISIGNDNLLAGSYTFISYIFPAAIGLWIAADPAPFAVAYRRILRTLVVLTTIICFYGVIQWVVSPPWDTLWLQNVIAQGSTSFGRPGPFRIRVWGTLNSPGPFAMYLAMVMLLVLPQLSLRRPILLLQMPIWIAAFALTSVRTGWLMFAAGAGVYVLFTPRRRALLITFGLTAAVVVASMTVLTTVIGTDALVTNLISRVNTLSDLQNDESSTARRELYSQSTTLIFSAPLGRGLGVLGTSTKLGKSESTTDFDSGFLSRVVEMGVPGFVLYIAPLVLLVVGAFRVRAYGQSNRDETAQTVAAMAMGVTVAFVGEQLGGDATGLMTLLFWLIMCLSMRARPAKDDSVAISEQSASGFAFSY